MKKRFKKRFVIIPSIIVFVLLASSLTVYFTLFHGKNGKDKEDDIINNLYDDTDDLMTRYQNLGPLEKPEDTFRPYELALIAEQTTFNLDHYYSYCDGEITAILGIKQYITSRFIKENGDCFEENISSGKVSVAHRYYENAIETTHYAGKCLSKTKGEFYEDKKETFSIKDFKHQWGRTIKEHHSIIVSQKTVKEDTLEIIDNNYYVKMSLDAELSSTLYGRWMMSTSNIEGMPLFHKIELEYRFDSNMKLVQFVSNCVYDAKQIIYVKNMKESIQENYGYDEKHIPSIN